jgi:hypothetical protein
MTNRPVPAATGAGIFTDLCESGHSAERLSSSAALGGDGYGDDPCLTAALREK